MEKHLSPLADRVLIVPEAVETKIGVLLLPENNKEKPQFAKVLQVGPEVKQERLKKWIGGIVMFGKHAGINVSVEGVDCKMVREAEIFATIGEQPTQPLASGEPDPIIPPTKL